MRAGRILPPMELANPTLMAAIMDQYALDPAGIHGPAHWKRVRDIGLRLAEDSGADPEVIRYFAVFHDSCRLNNEIDPEHGPRAACLVRALHGRAFALPEHTLQLLIRACDTHTSGQAGADEDPTVLTCWDADRLDLWRLDIRPDPTFLSTAGARREETILWARDLRKQVSKESSGKRIFCIMRGRGVHRWKQSSPTPH